MEQKVSIIVPIYNSAKYLKRCIESLITQTYHNLEIILVNDGSQDNSLQICTEYANKDNRIVLIDKTNGGQGSARNAGLDICNGDYIGFVDSDDWITENMYETLIYAIEFNACDLAICGWNNIRPKSLQKYGCFKEQKIYENSELVKSFFIEGDISSCLWNKLFSAKLFDHIRFPSIRVREDAYVMHVLISRANRAIHVGKALYNYNNCNESVERQKFNPNFLVSIEIANEQENFINLKYPELAWIIQKIQNDARIILINQIILSNYEKKYADKLNELVQFLRENNQLVDNQARDITQHFKLYSIKLKLSKLIHIIRS